MIARRGRVGDRLFFIVMAEPAFVVMAGLDPASLGQLHEVAGSGPAMTGAARSSHDGGGKVRT
jgi:hypothetical protein